MDFEGMSVFSPRFLILLGIGASLSILLLALPALEENTSQPEQVGEMEIQLPFDSTIPEKYSNYGQDVSPEVKFLDVPEETETVALIMEDKDAPVGSFTHWVVWNIPADSSLPENVSNREEMKNGAVQGTNDFGKTGYGGPEPPTGSHTYSFQAYALDTQLNLEAGASKQQLLTAMEGHRLAKDTVEADYTR